MLVRVIVDLTLDRPLMESSKSDHSIMALLRIYEASENDESCLEIIGQQIWNKSDYATCCLRCCGDDLYSFEQEEAFQFIFETEADCAFLFKTACANSAVVKIVEPKRIRPDVFFKPSTQ